VLGTRVETNDPKGGLRTGKDERGKRRFAAGPA
jgi:hypothetical protein